MNPAERAIVMLKTPRPGEVKTRLAAALGPDQAARLAQAFAEDALAAARQTGAPLAVSFTPAEAATEIATWLGPDIPLWPQVEDDLGRRMAHALGLAFAAGATHALLMGSDVPDAPPALIREALDLLSTHAAVLGPCEDGGFWCIGVSAHVFTPDMLDRLPWSSETTLAATVERLAALGVQPALLPQWRDVDTLSDLLNLQSRLEKTPNAAPATLARLRELPSGPLSGQPCGPSLATTREPARDD